MFYKVWEGLKVVVIGNMDGARGLRISGEQMTDDM